MTKKVTILKPKQRIALEALVAGETVTAAAARAGVAPKTVYAWLKQDVFKTALNEATAASMEIIRAGLVALSTDAMARLKDVLLGDKTSPAVRLRAADKIIERTAEFWQLGDLDRRLSALEGEEAEDEHPDD